MNIYFLWIILTELIAHGLHTVPKTDDTQTTTLQLTTDSGNGTKIATDASTTAYSEDESVLTSQVLGNKTDTNGKNINKTKHYHHETPHTVKQSDNKTTTKESKGNITTAPSAESLKPTEIPKTLSSPATEKIPNENSTKLISAARQLSTQMSRSDSSLHQSTRFLIKASPNYTKAPYTSAKISTAKITSQPVKHSTVKPEVANKTSQTPKNNLTVSATAVTMTFQSLNATTLANKTTSQPSNVPTTESATQQQKLSSPDVFNSARNPQTDLAAMISKLMENQDLAKMLLLGFIKNTQKENLKPFLGELQSAVSNKIGAAESTDSISCLKSNISSNNNDKCETDLKFRSFSEESEVNTSNLKHNDTKTRTSQSTLKTKQPQFHKRKAKTGSDKLKIPKHKQKSKHKFKKLVKNNQDTNDQIGLSNRDADDSDEELDLNRDKTTGMGTTEAISTKSYIQLLDKNHNGKGKQFYSQWLKGFSNDSEKPHPDDESSEKHQNNPSSEVSQSEEDSNNIASNLKQTQKHKSHDTAVTKSKEEDKTSTKSEKMSKLKISKKQQKDVSNVTKQKPNGSDIQEVSQELNEEPAITRKPEKKEVTEIDNQEKSQELNEESTKENNFTKNVDKGKEVNIQSKNTTTENVKLQTDNVRSNETDNSTMEISFNEDNPIKTVDYKNNTENITKLEETGNTTQVEYMEVMDSESQNNEPAATTTPSVMNATDLNLTKLMIDIEIDGSEDGSSNNDATTTGLPRNGTTGDVSSNTNVKTTDLPRNVITTDAFSNKVVKTTGLPRNVTTEIFTKMPEPTIATSLNTTTQQMEEVIAEEDIDEDEIGPQRSIQETVKITKTSTTKKSIDSPITNVSQKSTPTTKHSPTSVSTNVITTSKSDSSSSDNDLDQQFAPNPELLTKKEPPVVGKVEVFREAVEGIGGFFKNIFGR